MQKGLSANCSNLYGTRTKDTDFSKMFLLRNNQEVRTSNLAVKAEVWGIFFCSFSFLLMYIYSHAQASTDRFTDIKYIVFNIQEQN